MPCFLYIRLSLSDTPWVYGITVYGIIVILDKENKEHQRKICEAIHIKTKGPKLNRNDGHDLPDIYLPLLREEEGGRPTFASHRWNELALLPEEDVQIDIEILE